MKYLSCVYVEDLPKRKKKNDASSPEGVFVALPIWLIWKTLNSFLIVLFFPPRQYLMLFENIRPVCKFCRFFSQVTHKKTKHSKKNNKAKIYAHIYLCKLKHLTRKKKNSFFTLPSLLEKVTNIYVTRKRMKGKRGKGKLYAG